MPTQRPTFFASFFGAFRARTNPAFQAKSSAIAVTTGTNVTSSTPRSIPTLTNSSNQNGITSSSTEPQPIISPTATTTTKASNLSSSPGTYPHSHFYGPRSPGSSSPTAAHNGNLAMSPPGTTTPLTRGRQRRGSDASNSSGGFMDALGGDKWYIGGKTSGGDERFYRLGLVTGAPGKRVRSLDRLSL